VSGKTGCGASVGRPIIGDVIAAAGLALVGLCW